MSLIKIFLKELKNEAVPTRKMLSIIPSDKFGWKPHPKSMNIQQLGTHIAELPTWIPLVLNTTELDFATSPYEPEKLNNTDELLAYFEKCQAEAIAGLEQANESQLDDQWTLRNGTSVYSVDPKSEVIRMVINQIVHHRAQMGVFLRLLDIPIPGSYGPSADEMDLYK